MASLKSLEQALQEILRDDSKVSKYDAQAIRELILSDGRVSTEEKLFIERALKDNIFDEGAYEILSRILLREEMKYR